MWYNVPRLLSVGGLACGDTGYVFGVRDVARATSLPCRSRRSCLKYISKEDEEVFFNCREAELSFAYRAKAWSRRTYAFKLGDPFVLEHRNHWRFLQELHREVHAGISGFPRNV